MASNTFTRLELSDVIWWSLKNRLKLRRYSFVPREISCRTENSWAVLKTLRLPSLRWLLSRSTDTLVTVINGIQIRPESFPCKTTNLASRPVFTVRSALGKKSPNSFQNKVGCLCNSSLWNKVLIVSTDMETLKVVLSSLIIELKVEQQG